MSSIIYASATPEGTSALAVIRISGTGSASLVEKLMKLNKGRLSGMRRKVGNIYDGNNVVDNIVALTWIADKSYTGEEMVELICHGVPEIVENIRRVIKKNGAIMASPGEFTKKAYLAGKMSQTEVIALSLIFEGRQKQAEETGLFIKEYRRMLEKLRNFREELEGNIEFAEAHPSSGTRNPKETVLELAEESESLLILARSMEGKSSVWIMGPRNAGKSTLFNLLTVTGDALVSEIPGTTRDGAGKEIEISGKRLIIQDTAGTDGTGLDREAAEKVIDKLNSRDKIIWMSVGGEEQLPGKLRSRVEDVIEVASKSDICNMINNNTIPMSSVTGEGISELKKRLVNNVGKETASAIALSVRDAIQEAAGCINADDYALAGEILLGAEQELEMIFDEKSLKLSVERALSNLCVGK